MPPNSDVDGPDALMLLSAEQLRGIAASLNWVESESAALAARVNRLSQIPVRLDQQVDALEALLQNVCQELEERLSKDMTAVANETEGILVSNSGFDDELSQSTEDVGQSLAGVYDELAGAYQTGYEEIDATKDKIIEQTLALKASLEQTSQIVISNNEVLQAASENILTTLGKSIPSEIHTEYEEALSLFDKELGIAVQRLLSDTEHNVDAHLAQCKNAIDAELEQFRDAVANVVECSVELLETFVRETVDDVGHEFVDTALSEMTDALASSIIQVEINAATTSSLAPLLPYLITIRATVTTVKNLLHPL